MSVLLATANDLVRFGYSLPAESVYSALARASSRVRAYTQQTLTEQSNTTDVTGAGPWRLPERPVTEITKITDGDGVVVDDEYYSLVNEVLTVDDDVPRPLTVEYDSGLATLPDTLIEIVCQIAARIAAQPSTLAQGVLSEGALNESASFGSAAYQGVSGLTPGEERTLKRLYPRLPRTIGMKV